MSNLTPRGRALLTIAKERDRQIAKGYGTEHDDEHDVQDLADAAGCYAIGSDRVMWNGDYMWPALWVFKDSDNKERMLIKSAALLVAALEVVYREQERQGKLFTDESNGSD